MFDAYNGSRKTEMQIARRNVTLSQPVVTPNGKFLYLISYPTGVITMVSTVDNKVVGGDISLGEGEGPVCMVLAPNGNYLYVLSHSPLPSSPGSVSVVDISE